MFLNSSAQGLSADVLKRNELMVIAVPGSNVDFRTPLVKATANSSRSRKVGRSRSSSAAGTSHRGTHKSGKGSTDEISNTRHAGAAKSGIDLDDSPVADLFVVICHDSLATS